jgi:hypothetical protein
MNILEWIIAVGAALSAIIYIGKKIANLFKSWFNFMDDWYGNDENPGIIERLAEGNKRFEALEKDMGIIKAELFNNHGTSLRDAIDRIEQAVSNNEK